MGWTVFFGSGPLVAVTLSVLGLLITLLSVVYRVVGRLDGLEREISNHIASQIKELKQDNRELKQDNKELKEDNRQLKEDNRQLKEEVKIATKRIEDKLDQLINKISASA